MIDLKFKKQMNVLFLMGAVFILASCASAPVTKTGFSMHNGKALSMDKEEVKNFGSLTYKAVERLAKTAMPPLSSDKRVFVASMVDINDLKKSSTFGRLIGEHAGSKLAQLGYDIKELRLRSSILVLNGVGDLVLSRDLRKITGDVNAAAVVAGTYGIGGEWIYVNMRMIDADTGKIMSAVDFVVPLDKDTRKLISN